MILLYTPCILLVFLSTYIDHSFSFLLNCIFLGTLVVNPGQLAKGSFGGSYAEMSIHPLSEIELRDAKIAGKESIEHSVHSRTSVNILKI